ncbi:MAG: metallophosphoesterase family protein [Mariprofundaceae bacterium]|nr:metallophosphoesterase family protein [Mariprofundaceae bacterium]
MKSNLLTGNELNKAVQLDPTRELITVGAIANKPIAEDVSLALLNKQRQELGRDGEFIGKSTTCMYVDEHHVIKINQQCRFTDGRVALRWVELRLDKERKIALYHPSRTWFLYQDKGGWLAGNITIRLQAFHQMFEQKNLKSDDALPWIIQVCDKYLCHASRQKDRLDEGLSNFGLDGKILYYLDDDIFAWDHFHAFSALLAGWFRRYSSSWFHCEATEQLGEEIKRMLTCYFNDDSSIDAPQIIAAQIKVMFFPTGAIENAALAFREALLRHPVGIINGMQQAQGEILEQFSAYFDDDEPIALLGDIHANAPAFEAVLARIRQLKINRIFVVGDIVGYGPHPVECIEMLQKAGGFSLRGNHDHAIGSDQTVRTMSESSTWVASWTQQKIAKKHRDYLTNLPMRLLNRPWMAVHGAPVDQTFFNAYVYDRTAEKNLQHMMNEGYLFCIHGHSHIQGVYLMQWESRVRKITNQKEIDLATPATAKLICPGSVGQPRDGNTQAAFSVLYPNEQRLVNYREAYPVHQTIQDMIIHRFPEQLIERLRQGL